MPGKPVGSVATACVVNFGNTYHMAGDPFTIVWWRLGFTRRSHKWDRSFGRLDGGRTTVEFSWEQSDDNTHASGRGWTALGTAGRLVGHIFIHKGDDSGFVAESE